MWIRAVPKTCSKKICSGMAMVIAEGIPVFLHQTNTTSTSLAMDSSYSPTHSTYAVCSRLPNFLLLKTIYLIMVSLPLKTLNSYDEMKYQSFN